MYDQINLWETGYETYKEPEKKVEKTRETEFLPCAFCGVMPKSWINPKKMKTLDGWDRATVAECPKCHYMCSTFYNIVEHWNDLQRHRLKELK